MPSPNRKARLRDIVPPKIQLVSFPNPSTEVSAMTMLNISFAVSDAGSRASGLRRWALEYRRNGAPWNAVPGLWAQAGRRSRLATGRE
jgi:hypothetical protein